jgi:hypothetical protein
MQQFNHEDMPNVIERRNRREDKLSIGIFIAVPCILIILTLFSPTNAHFIEYIKSH